MKLSGSLNLSRFEWAAQQATYLLQQQPDANFYDIGSGENAITNFLNIDQSKVHLFDLQPLKPEIEQWDIEQNFPYNYPQASIITCLEIIEHLNNPWLCLKNIAGVTATGGYLILTTPNPGWSTSRLNLLFKGFLTCFTPQDLEVNHHVFTVWPHILKKLLNDNGFEIVEFVTIEGQTKLFDPGLSPLRAIFQIPARLVKKFIEYKDPLAKGMSYGVVARKIG